MRFDDGNGFAAVNDLSVFQPVGSKRHKTVLALMSPHNQTARAEGHLVTTVTTTSIKSVVCCDLWSNGFWFDANFLA